MGNARTRQRARGSQHWQAAMVGVVVVIVSVGCSTLLGADPTPVPGAAATLTRSIRTPIPTPVPAPRVSAVPSRAASSASPGPSPAVASQGVSEEDIAQLQRRMEQAVGSPDLPGVESLLLDHIAFSTAEGGSVMDTSAAAAWLRDHAGPGIKVTSMERATQTLTLQVMTDGWPKKDPIQQGQVSFSLRRYDANGRLDEENGAWKVDVIEAV